MNNTIMARFFNTMFVTITAISISTLFGCSSYQRKTNNDPALFFPTRPLIIEHEDTAYRTLKLSYTEVSITENETIYQVNSTYENKNIGFELDFPSKGSGKLTFKSSGSISDNFVHLLQIVYKQKVDTASKFRDLVTADCLSMGDYLDSLHKIDNGHYVTVSDYKLFFNADSSEGEAESYLNINDTEHWIEFAEKDLDYRPEIIKMFTKK